MNINDIAERAYSHAKQAGFIGDRNIDSMLMDIVDEVSEIRNCKKNRCDNPNIFPWIEEHKDFIENGFCKLFEINIKDRLEDELTNILLITLAIMKHYGVDIEKHIDFKMTYNELRDDHK